MGNAQTDIRAFETEVTRIGRDPGAHHGSVSIPAYPVSTLLAPDLESYLAAESYGRLGTPTSRAAETAAAALEGGAEAIAYPSGLAAITGALLGLVKAGDHLLVADTIYGPTRAFCQTSLTALGVKISFFDPTRPAELPDLLRPETMGIYLESPGSGTFEMADVGAFGDLARAHGLTLVLDSTWSAGVFFRGLDHGAHMVIQSATKYWGGHSDLMLGFVIADQAHAARARETATLLGACTAPEPCFLMLRGLRSLPLRMRQHQAAGLAIAEYLAGRPEVETLRHPAFPDCPGHHIWKRDYSGSAGVFGAMLAPCSDAQVSRFFAALDLFGIGDSWGGFESLIVPARPERSLANLALAPDARLLRLHIGLEDADDLIRDLDRAFAAMNG